MDNISFWVFQSFTSPALPCPRNVFKSNHPRWVKDENKVSLAPLEWDCKKKRRKQFNFHVSHHRLRQKVDDSFNFTFADFPWRVLGNSGFVCWLVSSWYNDGVRMGDWWCKKASTRFKGFERNLLNFTISKNISRACTTIKNFSRAYATLKVQIKRQVINSSCLPMKNDVCNWSEQRVALKLPAVPA